MTVIGTIPARGEPWQDLTYFQDTTGWVNATMGTVTIQVPVSMLVSVIDALTTAGINVTVVTVPDATGALTAAPGA